MKKFLSVLIMSTYFVLIMWGVGSYIEILLKNLSQNPQYNPLNLFLLIF